MASQHNLEIVVLLVVVVLALTTLARSLLVPYPIVLVLGGLALGFVPGLPRVSSTPTSCSSSSCRRSSGRPPTSRPGATSAPTSGRSRCSRSASCSPPRPRWPRVAHWLIPGLGMAGGLRARRHRLAARRRRGHRDRRRLGIPRRIVTILEGESLVNDATALVAYRASRSPRWSTGAFVAPRGWRAVRHGSAGGVAVGPGGGGVARLGRSRAAERLADRDRSCAARALRRLAAWPSGCTCSAVLACVAAGIYVPAALQRGRGAGHARAGARRLGGARVPPQRRWSSS